MTARRLAKAIVSVMAGALVIAGLAAPPAFAAGEGTSESKSLADMKTVTLEVDNMYCASCPFIVERSLERVPGVREVTISFEEKEAVVTFDPAVSDVTALISATTEAGYPARLAQGEAER